MTAVPAGAGPAGAGPACLHCGTFTRPCPLEDPCPGWDLHGTRPCTRCTWGWYCPAPATSWAGTTPQPA